MGREKGFLLVLSQFSLTQQCKALPHEPVKVLHEKVAKIRHTVFTFSTPKFTELNGESRWS